MCAVIIVRRSEAWLLAAASVVLVAGLVTVPFLYGDTDRSSSGGPPPAGPTPSPSPSPAPPDTLRVSGVRVTTYSRGSHQLVVRATVGAGTSVVQAVVQAVVQLGDRAFAMKVVDGEVTGTVLLTCSGPVPELVLAVTTANGSELTASLGRPAAAAAEACAAPRPGAPVPTSSPGGS
jgi:nucleoid-associated protein YgaU